MGASLFEINRSIEELTDKLIDPDTGEINEEVMEQLDRLEMDQDEKLEAYGMVILNLKSEIEALLNQSKAFKARADVKMHKVNRMEEMAARTLKGQKKEYTNVAFSFRKSKSVNVVNEEVVPDELCMFRTERKPNKVEIKKLLNAGEVVPGCVLEEKLNLNVK